MSLCSGDKLGHYEIASLLGKGGMGEVYRARDTQLDRDVAIKALPAALARDPERLARFEREAKILASLNHPNIAIIYGLTEAQGSRVLVMELVEGETLTSTIKRGPIPLEDACKIARQIAEAVEAAHDRGVVHRDLKPGNVMVTPAGLVKVLDFGLAAIAQPSGGGDPESSPTLTIGATAAGTILGTASYMSPEQAAGKPVDKRADIWSFGVVLWEMLTGKRLFEAETVSHTLADVLRAPIDFEELPAGTPRTTRRLLERCLDRDARNRLRDIGEARVAIDTRGDVDAVVQPPAAGEGPKRASKGWITAAVVLGLIAGAAGLGWWRGTRAVELPLVRLDVDLGADITLPPPGPNGPIVALSPDATRLAYVAIVADGKPKLFTRRLDQAKPTELAGTENADAPFFSPDSRWIGFSNATGLFKISVEGGAVVPLSGTIFGPASWGEDGSILAGTYGHGLLRIPSGGGGQPTTAVEQGNGEFVNWAPQILPGGKAALYLTYSAPQLEGASLSVVTLADRRTKVLVRGGMTPRYAPTSERNGHLLYLNKSTLFAIPFDLDKLETQGTAVPILDDVAFYNPGGMAQFNVSSGPAGRGTLVYRKSKIGASATTTVQWLDPLGASKGNRQTLAAKPGEYAAPRFSPDGQRLAMQVLSSGGVDIWVYEVPRDAWTRLSFGGGHIAPIWSPDGRYVVYGSIAGGMYLTRGDGAGQPQQITQSKSTQQQPLSFTPDGKRLGYSELDTSGRAKLQMWTLPIDVSGGQVKPGKPEQVFSTEFDEIGPVFSPDGRWMAYISNESGKGELYVRALPSASASTATQGGRSQVSNNGATLAFWSRNGRDLLYQSGDQIMAVSYTVHLDSNGSATFIPDKPRVWAARLGAAASGVAPARIYATAPSGGPPMWDLHPDGKRIAVVSPANIPEAPESDHEVVFLQNFFDELRRKAPLK